MSAYNRRFQPKEIFGVSLYAALGGGAALVFGVFSLLLPLALKLITVPVTLAALSVAAVAVWLGDDLPLAALIWRGKRVEPGRVTAEIPGPPRRRYADLYTWSHPYGDYAIAHADGAVSIMIEWAGLDAEMLTELERAQRFSALYTVLGAIGTGYCAEFHLWREADASLADEYLARNTELKRGQALAVPVRAAMAAHLGQFGMSNEVALVLTKLPGRQDGLAALRNVLALGGARRRLINQAGDAEELVRRARSLTPKLPGARIVDSTCYLARIVQSHDRAAFARGAQWRHEPRMDLAEQLLREAPRIDSGQVRVGTALTKVLYLYLYPDAAPAWFAGMAALPIPMHVCQVVMPVDTKQAINASERASDLAEGSMGRRGRSVAKQTLLDLAGFQSFVTSQGLSIYKNAYIVHLHGAADELDEQARVLTDWIESSGGQVRAADYAQLPYFRAAQPGQGYRAPILRPDHTWQIAHMAPVQVYRQGERRPESLRLGASGTLIGFGLSTQTVPHSFTVAITGGGKGVEKVATIAETYPFGIDWYIAEIGGSYKWVVEGFGGVYSKIDPTATVVNPLPPYAVADAQATYPLNAVIAGGTVNALSFLLNDGTKELSAHQTSAAQEALQLLYAAPDAARLAPTLPDFLVELESCAREIESEPRRKAAQDMAHNLSSFLETTEGRIFANDDNLVLSEGITGVDLKEVDRASPKLLKFYLVFLALRFNHLAFARRNPARVLLDEMHKFVSIAPEVMGRLISELARMGRKDAAAIDLVTQGIAEIDVIEAEVLNSMPLRTLLYRSDGWEDIAGRIAMPAGPLALWKSYPYPLALPYRPALKSVGQEYYNLHCTFPKIVLDLAATSPQDLDLKDALGARISDPLERLHAFRHHQEHKR